MYFTSMTSWEEENFSSNSMDELKDKLKKIKILLMDVDGVLTDGRITLWEDKDLVFFNIYDGLGITVAQKLGLKIGWISSRTSSSILRRGENLKVSYLYVGREDKEKALWEILGSENLSVKECGYIADDINDLPVLKKVGVRFAVANARPEVKSLADYVTQAPGGKGAVREVIELILKSKGLWDKALKTYSKEEEEL